MRLVGADVIVETSDLIATKMPSWAINKFARRFPNGAVVNAETLLECQKAGLEPKDFLAVIADEKTFRAGTHFYPALSEDEEIKVCRDRIDELQRGLEDKRKARKLELMADAIRKSLLSPYPGEPMT